MVDPINITSFLTEQNLFFSLFFTDDVESLKSPQRGIIQSIFCCWRRNQTKTTQNGLPVFNSGQSVSTLQGRHRHLLPQVRHQDMHKKCMVIDLDETLVHSSFKVSVLYREFIFHLNFRLSLLLIITSSDWHLMNFVNFCWFKESGIRSLLYRVLSMYESLYWNWNFLFNFEWNFFSLLFSHFSYSSRQNILMAFFSFLFVKWFLY